LGDVPYRLDTGWNRIALEFLPCRLTVLHLLRSTNFAGLTNYCHNTQYIVLNINFDRIIERKNVNAWNIKKDFDDCDMGPQGLCPNLDASEHACQH
jgi:hypothetical protein